MKKIKDWTRMDGFYEVEYEATEEIELKKREYRIRQVMNNVEECVRWEDLENHVFDGVLREFSYKVAVDEFEKRTIEYPSNWIEAIKDRFFTERMKKRLPIRTTKIECSLEHIYPDIDVRIPDHTPTVKFYVHKHEQK